MTDSLKVETNKDKEINELALNITEISNSLQKKIITRLLDSNYVAFKLSKKFVAKYFKIKPDFGFNGLGEIVYRRTYSRKKQDGTNEQWFETVERVVNGTYNMQKRWILDRGLAWDEEKAQESAEEMYERMFEMKFLPPGRGLWAMGSQIIEERGLNCSLNNCGFVSTENIDKEFSRPFLFLMDMSMLGVGIGFDVKGAGKIVIKKPSKHRQKEVYEVPDTREGWVYSVEILLDSYFKGTPEVEFNYDLIRKEGEPIKGFGGTSSGYKPLMNLHFAIKDILNTHINKKITITVIADIMNLIGRCVVSGNVRRTAEIIFGDTSEEYLDLKNYEINPERESYGWTSNNSIFAELGMDYSEVAKRTKNNGEPGYLWIDNIQDYGRMVEAPNYKDHRAMGANPCCFDGDTIIAVADGRNGVNIRQLTEEGKDVPVYCKNENGETTIRWMRQFQKTGENEEVYKVTLDDDSTIITTGNHKYMLLDGTWSYCKDLKIGYSLMPFNSYVRNNRRLIQNKYNKFNYVKDIQYRRIYKFFNDNADVGNPNFPIHHLDFNSANDNINNLKQITKEEHSKIHDQKGKNNRMFGKKHSIETKIKIGNKTKNKDRYKKWKEVISNFWKSEKGKNIGKDCAITLLNYKKETQKYFLNLALSSGLNAILIDNYCFVIKNCDFCGEEFKVHYSKRNACFCNKKCQMFYYANLEKRKSNQLLFFKNRQEKILNNQINVYNELKNKFGRIPLKKEWEDECKNRKISYRIRNNYKGSNPYIINSFKDLKEKCSFVNHKIKKIELIGVREVYNGTVDEFHNVAIITSTKDNRFMESSGIFVFQSEQTLEDKELCCLVETFPYRHKAKEDFLRTLKFAYLYAKTVTLGETHWPETNRVLLRNRRIGCSVSGVVQFLTDRGIAELKEWLEEGYEKIQYYDEVYSDWFCIPKSIKTTSVKPSGSVSLLAGATPGVHFPISEYYLRRIRLGRTSELIKPLEKAGYKIEPCFGSEDSTVVVEIPVHVGKGIRSEKDVSMWEKLSLAAFMQGYWADNQVSCTVTFETEKEGKDIVYALNYFQYWLKSISFLPIKKDTYKQMPYEAITKEHYTEVMNNLKKLDFSKANIENEEQDKFCDGQTCTLN